MPRTETSSKNLIEVQDLGFSFEQPVLQRVSFTVRENQFVSFVGPSGCGKTTLLYVLLGLYDNFDGSVEVNCEHASFVFQHETLLEWRTATANVLLPFELRGERITDELRRKAQKTLALVGLSGYGHLFPMSRFLRLTSLRVSD